MIVVSDASPLHYLILIGREQLLPELFGRVLAPPSVAAELSHERTPTQMREWIANAPQWFVLQPPKGRLPGLERLGAGEADAISLAHENGR